jgi:tetratricopeptide (TPR) repeat protein
MKRHKIHCLALFVLAVSCSKTGDKVRQSQEAEALNLLTGEITLCGSGPDQFGKVSFDVSGSEKIKADFNLATALLHSFEYTEAEKIFAKIIDEDSTCIMAYWGAAMCNFHALWAPPTESELEKGTRIISAARSMIADTSSRESLYIEAIASIYDNWKELPHKSRLLKFESAAERITKKYPADKEATIFYALALAAASDPTDKTFQKQKKATALLNPIFANNPLHPGLAHYLIHICDYPELAALALDVARKYASIAPASAHAQHMPSHIFTRLGLWDECIRSNQQSISSAQCYAQKNGATGHWDEELHGMDYLVYAYLQKGDDASALEQLEYLRSITEVFPKNFKVAYAFAAIPSRYALERKDWTAAVNLHLTPENFPWQKSPWEKLNMTFARLLGATHTNQLPVAYKELHEIENGYDTLVKQNQSYMASLVLVQKKTGEAWIRLKEGKRAEAIKVMTEAADAEDATAKNPVTPGEIIPARELLGDMFFELGDFTQALKAYEEDLRLHRNRFNGLFGAGYAAEKSGDRAKAKEYYEKLLQLTESTPGGRKELVKARAFLKKDS